MTLDMNILPNDIFKIVLSYLDIAEVYSLKNVSKAICHQVVTCQNTTSYLPETFWGVNVKNVNLLGRDYSLNYKPYVFGLMTVKIFKKFMKYFKPADFIINSDTSTLNLTKHLLKNNMGLNLVICVNQKNLMTINKTKISIHTEYLTIFSEDKITMEVSMQLLQLNKQNVKHLKIHGEMNDMRFVFSMLPKNLESLEIYSKIGVHDVRSLPYFFELKLKYLNLFQCYEICSHPECINYNSITSQVKKCVKFPQKVAMSPFPFDAIKWCVKNDTEVDFTNSCFFEFEHDDVMNYSLNSSRTCIE